MSGKSEETASSSAGLRKFCTVFAVIGALALAYQLIGYAIWLTGPDFAPVSPGPDPIPAALVEQLRGTEKSMAIVAIFWTAFLIGYTLWKRRLTWPAVLTLVWSATYWLDSTVNLGNQAFTLNLHFFNRGDWIASLPFGPVDGPTLTQPLIVEATAFYALNPIFSIVGAGVMALFFKLGLRSTVILALVGAGVGIALDSFAELSGIAGQVLAWNRAWPPLTISAGTVHQWPVYEGLMLGTFWTLMGIFYFFRGSNRFSPWDHGLAFIRSAAARNGAIICMLIGLLNMLFLTYNLILVGFSMHSPVVPGIPSYLGGSAG